MDQQRRANVSPNLNQDYDKTQMILEKARARSREQVFLYPASGNGYEKHNGSPQRTSPKRDCYEPPARTSYHQQQYANTSYIRQSHSPL